MRNANWLKWLPCAVFSCQSPPAPGHAPESAAARVTDVRTDAKVEPHSARAPGKGQAGVASNCINYSTTIDGPFQYQNNMWAQDKATGPYEQCVLSQKIDGKTRLGWTWNWHGFEELGFGYPEIIFGWKPWQPTTTDPRLPMRIADLRKLAVRYAVATENEGKINLSFSMFLTDSGAVSGPNPLAIVAEIVVWLDYPEGAKPIGTLVDKSRVVGVDYQLWHAPDHGDRGDKKGWDLFFFSGPRSQLRGTVALDAFLALLGKRGLIGQDRFLASVEFGNELLSGSGTTWVEDFDVALESRH